MSTIVEKNVHFVDNFRLFFTNYRITGRLTAYAAIKTPVIIAFGSVTEYPGTIKNGTININNCAVV